ncbi:hypothetical protein [Paeniglutamicibacter antarcticus]
MNKPAKTVVFRVGAVASIGLLGLGLAGCSTDEAAPTATATVTESASATAAPETTPAASSPAASTKATAESSSAAAERKVTLEVKGAKSNALVKTLVITHNGKKTGGKMVKETLPFTKDLTLPADTTFTKILVLGKYADGGTGDISCDITIDGKSESSNSSTGHKPAECLFIEKGAKN